MFSNLRSCSRVINTALRSGGSNLQSQLKGGHQSKGILNSVLPVVMQQRSLFLNWLNTVFNKVSQDRIEEVGPDRACAEWLLRNGALVQWVGSKEFVDDYNNLPLRADEKGSYHIKAVDATKSTIMAIGFPHFEGCKHIQQIIFNNCKYLDDQALPLLSPLKDSLKSLEILYCWNLTNAGLLSLSCLSNLQKLKIEGLPEVTNKSEVEKKLQEALPKCEISFNT